MGGLAGVVRCQPCLDVRGEAYVMPVGVGDALEEVDVISFRPYWCIWAGILVGDIIAEGAGLLLGA